MKSITSFLIGITAFACLGFVVNQTVNVSGEQSRLVASTNMFGLTNVSDVIRYNVGPNDGMYRATLYCITTKTQPEPGIFDLSMEWVDLVQTNNVFPCDIDFTLLGNYNTLVQYFYAASNSTILLSTITPSETVTGVVYSASASLEYLSKKTMSDATKLQIPIPWAVGIVAFAVSAMAFLLKIDSRLAKLHDEAYLRYEFRDWSDELRTVNPGLKVPHVKIIVKESSGAISSKLK